jgi:hypothetical protein
LEKGIGVYWELTHPVFGRDFDSVLGSLPVAEFRIGKFIVLLDKASMCKVAGEGLHDAGGRLTLHS